MKTQIIISLKMLLVMTVLTGMMYPLMITGLARLMFPVKANGSFVYNNGEIVGSALIGQKFTSERYFWPRPSANEYNPLPSGGTNYGMTNQILRTSKEDMVRNFRRENNIESTVQIPNEMIFSSASGLDPHISVQAARLQVSRIARARALDDARINLLIEKFTENRQYYFLGQERVNVLLLNLELDSFSNLK